VFLELRPKRNEATSALWPASNDTCLSESLHMVTQSRLRHGHIKIRLEVFFSVGENYDDAEANGIAKCREGAFQGHLAQPRVLDLTHASILVMIDVLRTSIIRRQWTSIPPDSLQRQPWSLAARGAWEPQSPRAALRVVPTSGSFPARHRSSRSRASTGLRPTSARPVE
jgi:hypothetical protein